jgi:hypothetical protein
MTNREAFSPTEWEDVLMGPPSAGMMVVSAQRGGTLRETISIGKAYVEARKGHGDSELLDEIVAAKPEFDHTRYHSAAELNEHALGHLRNAAALLQAKATAQEREDYKRFVVDLAERVAGAHREAHSADPVSPAEQAAIDSIVAALG